MPNLSGKVCLVTGASRGIGRGTALQLLANGATCYITGRKQEALLQVKEEAKTRGEPGICLPIKCDHGDDADIRQVFKQIKEEQNGRLDLLVNNAYSAAQFITDHKEKYFWEQPDDAWDEINNVGLRNHYMCTVHAARLMVRRRAGLIVTVGSMGSLVYFLTPAYGVGKAAKEKMVRDCAAELRPFGVAAVSVWPGPALTEANQAMRGDLKNVDDPTLRWILQHGCESAEFAGRGISHLLADRKGAMRRTGGNMMTTDLAARYGFRDVDGERPVSMRSQKAILATQGWFALANLCPELLRLPFFLVKLAAPLAPPMLGKKTLASDTR